MAPLGKLIKLLELTRSDNDHEALSAIRAANRALRTAGLAWDSVVTDAPATGRPGAKKPPKEEAREDKTTADGLPAGPAMSNKLAWKSIFDYLSEVFLNEREQYFFDGIISYYTSRGYLTEKQRPWVYKMYRDKGGDQW